MEGGGRGREMRGGVHLKRRDTGIYKEAALQKS